MCKVDEFGEFDKTKFALNVWQNHVLHSRTEVGEVLEVVR
jgi:hypothetical protein